MKKQTFKFENLSPDVIQVDPNQPRKSMEVGSKERLYKSISEVGILLPLIVGKANGNSHHLIIDGHRRFHVAKSLQYKHIPCIVVEDLKKSEVDFKRSEIQSNLLPWKPNERSVIVSRIKKMFQFKTNRQLAEKLFVSPSLVGYLLKLKEEDIEMIEMMEKYDLEESYRVEFLKLLPKIRKIRSFEIPQISNILFEKVQNRVITNAKDFRLLGKTFNRATSNEEVLYGFLTDPDMTISELEETSEQTGLALRAERLIGEYDARKRKVKGFSPQEVELLYQFYDRIKEDFEGNQF